MKPSIKLQTYLFRLRLMSPWSPSFSLASFRSLQSVISTDLSRSNSRSFTYNEERAGPRQERGNKPVANAAEETDMDDGA